MRVPRKGYIAAAIDKGKTSFRRSFTFLFFSPDRKSAISLVHLFALFIFFYFFSFFFSALDKIYDQNGAKFDSLNRENLIVIIELPQIYLFFHLEQNYDRHETKNRTKLFPMKLVSKNSPQFIVHSVCISRLWKNETSCCGLQQFVRILKSGKGEIGRKNRSIKERRKKGKSSELSQGYERISLGWTCNRARIGTLDFSFSILFFAPLNTI